MPEYSVFSPALKEAKIASLTSTFASHPLAVGSTARTSPFSSCSKIFSQFLLLIRSFLFSKINVCYFCLNFFVQKYFKNRFPKGIQLLVCLVIPVLNPLISLSQQIDIFYLICRQRGSKLGRRNPPFFLKQHLRRDGIGSTKHCSRALLPQRKQLGAAPAEAPFCITVRGSGPHIGCHRNQAVAAGHWKKGQQPGIPTVKAQFRC